MGNAESAVTLTCGWCGPRQPPLPPEPVHIAARLGLDLNPLDLQNAADVMWPRALIWPELVERARLLETAIRVAQAARPAVWRGDALALLPHALAQAPTQTTLCLWHSFTLNQITPEARAAFTAQLAAVAAHRPLDKISLEWGTNCALLSLSTFTAGEEHTALLARCDPHGAWLEWAIQHPPHFHHRASLLTSEAVPKDALLFRVQALRQAQGAHVSTFKRSLSSSQTPTPQKSKSPPSPPQSRNWSAGYLR